MAQLPSLGPVRAEAPRAQAVTWAGKVAQRLRPPGLEAGPAGVDRRIQSDGSPSISLEQKTPSACTSENPNFIFTLTLPASTPQRPSAKMAVAVGEVMALPDLVLAAPPAFFLPPFHSFLSAALGSSRVSRLWRPAATLGDPWKEAAWRCRRRAPGRCARPPEDGRAAVQRPRDGALSAGAGDRALCSGRLLPSCRHNGGVNGGEEGHFPFPPFPLLLIL
jgi:hypothetical protein